MFTILEFTLVDLESGLACMI